MRIRYYHFKKSTAKSAAKKKKSVKEALKSKAFMRNRREARILNAENSRKKFEARLQILLS